mgnify:CR=1 FL=1
MVARLYQIELDHCRTFYANFFPDTVVEVRLVLDQFRYWVCWYRFGNRTRPTMDNQSLDILKPIKLIKTKPQTL